MPHGPHRRPKKHPDLTPQGTRRFRVELLFHNMGKQVDTKTVWYTSPNCGFLNQLLSQKLDPDTDWKAVLVWPERT